MVQAGQAELLEMLLHELRRADSRAACTAGSKRPTSTPMIAITTKSSTKVNPLACGERWVAGRAWLALWDGYRI